MKGQITIQERFGHGDGSDYTVYTGELKVGGGRGHRLHRAPYLTRALVTHNRRTEVFPGPPFLFVRIGCHLALPAGGF